MWRNINDCWYTNDNIIQSLYDEIPLLYCKDLVFFIEVVIIIKVLWFPWQKNGRHYPSCSALLYNNTLVENHTRIGYYGLIKNHKILPLTIMMSNNGTNTFYNIPQGLYTSLVDIYGEKHYLAHKTLHENKNY